MRLIRSGDRDHLQSVQARIFAPARAAGLARASAKLVQPVAHQAPGLAVALRHFVGAVVADPISRLAKSRTPVVLRVLVLEAHQVAPDGPAAGERVHEPEVSHLAGDRSVGRVVLGPVRSDERRAGKRGDQCLAGEVDLLGAARRRMGGNEDQRGRDDVARLHRAMPGSGSDTPMSRALDGFADSLQRRQDSDARFEKGRSWQRSGRPMPSCSLS